MDVHCNARSDVKLRNPAYVDITFGTENGSYMNILKLGTLYAEQLVYQNFTHL